MIFVDRTEAGLQLAARLEHLRGQDAVVLGLPRGGVPVAFEVARHLDAPLDVVVVRKLGLPGNREVAMGALGEGGVVVRNQDVLLHGRVSEATFAAVEAEERSELERRLTRVRQARQRVPLAGRTAVVVDDGIATGATARAACQVVRAAGASSVVLAVPVAAEDTLRALRKVADDVVSLQCPREFVAVGQWYRDFAPVGDEEVLRLLERSDRPAQGLTPRARDVTVETGDASLPGLLTLPDRAPLTVVFAHGSGSSRHSPRNAFAASVLHRAGIGTLLVDLLTPQEAQDRDNVFDVPLLARRVHAAASWLRATGVGPDRIGYLGSSTGAAAALWAAAEPDADVTAVVSRGGRPDLATARLGGVVAPTLLVVGSRDAEVLALNRTALARLPEGSQLAVVPGASHLFAEPGTLREAAELARDWFLGHAPPAEAAVSAGRRAGRT